TQAAAQGKRERRLARSDRATDPDPQWAVSIQVSQQQVSPQERNSREYCVSCRIEARASAGEALDHSSGSSRKEQSTAASMQGPRASSRRCAATCPIGSAFIRTIVWFSAKLQTRPSAADRSSSSIRQ